MKKHILTTGKSQYNPLIHHRRSIRLKGYDYSRAGLYFITICIHNRQCLFGEILNGEIQLNEFGWIAHHQWEKISERFSNVELDVFQIMPSHMHGIIVLNEPVGATLAVAPDNMNAPNNDPDTNDIGTRVNRVPTFAPDNMNAPNNDPDINDIDPNIGTRVNRVPTVGDIIGAYKSLVANKCLELFKSKHPDKLMGKLWQRNYYEHIIRDEQALDNIRQYIIDNPAQWSTDKLNPFNRS